MSSKKSYEVLKAQTGYAIPINEIKARGNVYELYKDAQLSLSEAYEYVKKQLPLPNLTFPPQPSEKYQTELDRVFNLLVSRN